MSFEREKTGGELELCAGQTKERRQMIAKGLKKTYGKDFSLDIEELCLEKAKVYAVLGGNGSGKSTLARLLSGSLPSEGGKPIWTEKPTSLRYLPQKCYAFRLKAIDSILLGGSNRERALFLSERLGISNLLQKSEARLSGGERARVCLARAMMTGAELLILDEPTAAMDIESTLSAERLIREYSEEFSAAVILISHSINQAKRVSDYSIFLQSGRLVEQGETLEMLDLPRTDEFRRFVNFY